MYKKIIANLMVIAIVAAGIQFAPKQAQAAVHSSAGSSSWSLVWNDEFNQNVGSAPNTEIWNYDIGTGASGWGNNELQYYTDSTDNVYIADMTGDEGSSDGRSLAIKAKRDGGHNPSSGNFNGANGDSPWPSSGEIDIMEHRNTESNVIGTLHWNPSSDAYGHTYKGSETTGQFGGIGTIEQWHRYSVEWYEDVMKWYVDDTCYQTIDISSAEMDEFQRSHFILLNLALGSANSPFTVGQTVSDSFTDATMYVDYVRVYQGTDSSFEIHKKEVSETQPEATTAWDGYTKAVVDNKTNLGEWGYFFGSYAGASGSYKGGTEQKDFSLRVESNNYADWGVQMFTKQIGVTSGKTYRYTIKLNSDVAGASVTLKDEIGGNDLSTQTLISGENVFTGTVTASSDTVQFMYDLAKVMPGTTLTVTDFSLTEESGGEVIPPTGNPDETTPASSEDDWIEISGGSPATYYYDKNTDVKAVIGIQSPPWAEDMGIYMDVPNAINDVSVNGISTETVAKINGAGCLVYLSALTKNINEVIINYLGGTATIKIKNAGVSEEVVTPEETTSKDPSEITTHKDVKIEGFQISTTYEGIRIVGSVEPQINNQDVSTWGLIYGLYCVNGSNTGITDKDMVMDSENVYVQGYESTSAGTLSSKLGESDTATYFCRTMKFGGNTAIVFSAQYKVRAYAKLADGSYVYSDIEDYSIYDIADLLYNQKLMNTYDGHVYLYENILKIVDSGYPEADYNWNNSVLKPDEIEE